MQKFFALVFCAFVLCSIKAQLCSAQEVEIVNQNKKEISLGYKYDGCYKVEVDKKTKEAYEIVEVPASSIKSLESIMMCNHNQQFATPNAMFPFPSSQPIEKEDFLRKPQWYMGPGMLIVHNHEQKRDFRCTFSKDEISKVFVDFERKGGSKDSEKKKVVIKKKITKDNYTPYVIFYF